MKNATLPLCALISLAACGGATTTATTPVASVPTPTPVVVAPASYASLSSTSSGTSTLAGVGIRTASATGQSETTQLNGSLNHAGRAIQLSDGTYVFLSNASGFKPTGTTNDANGATLTSQNATIGAGYQYLGVFNGAYNHNGTAYDTLGVGGIVTIPTDITQSGAVTFRGQGEFILVTTTNGTTFLADGDVFSTVNFGNNQMNTSISAFDATDSNGNTVAQPEIGQINILGTTINGSSFSGGTVQFINGQGGTTSLGAGTTTTMTGTFFGFDQSTGAPDELGGVLQAEGLGGSISGVFVAD